MEFKLQVWSFVISPNSHANSFDHHPQTNLSDRPPQIQHFTTNNQLI